LDEHPTTLTNYADQPAARAGVAMLLRRSPRGGALHLRPGVSGNDFTGHEVGEAV
jgi:hypothetical protein